MSQYTIRNVPPRLDAAIRESSRRQGKSLNQVALEALSESFGLGPTPVQYRDLSDIAGTWVEDPEVEAALEDQRRIDVDLWR